MGTNLTNEDVEEVARRVVALLGAQNAAPRLRNTYSTEEFAAEVLDGKRQPEWVRKQCRLGKIKTVGRRPFAIPQSEAARFLGRIV